MSARILGRILTSAKTLEVTEALRLEEIKASNGMSISDRGPSCENGLDKGNGTSDGSGGCIGIDEIDGTLGSTRS